ncbi:MAG: hypothetical protein LBR72_00765 [Oscillospiraceae bacterium]|nr:hypothetical protein [Oscillospiraceae bacterium]
MTRKHLLRGIFFGALLVLCVVLQTRVLTRFPAFPNALAAIPAVVALSVFAGPVAGGVAGLLTGLLCDALTPTVEALYALSLMAAGFLTGSLCVRTLQKTFWSALLLTAGWALIIEFLVFFLFYLLPGRTVWPAFLTVGLPEAGGGVLFLLPLYPLFRGGSRLFEGRS